MSSKREIANSSISNPDMKNHSIYHESYINFVGKLQTGKICLAMWSLKKHEHIGSRKNINKWLKLITTTLSKKEITYPIIEEMERGLWHIVRL